MTINVAHIKNGVVDNVAVYETLPQSTTEYEYIDVTDLPVGMHWEYADGVFSHPDYNFIYSLTEGRIDLAVETPPETPPAEPAPQ